MWTNYRASGRLQVVLLQHLFVLHPSRDKVRLCRFTQVLLLVFYNLFYDGNETLDNKQKLIAFILGNVWCIS